MPSTTDIDIQDGLFALFKGESGAGKSVAALSFPTPYVFDIDRKMPNIARKHFPGKKIDWDIFPSMLDIATKMNDFATMGCEYETLIFDSLTSLSALVLKSYGDLKGEDTIKLLQSIKRTKSGGSQAELMGVDYYNAETKFLNFFMDAIKTLWTMPGNPKNVILIAHIVKWKSSPDLKTKAVTEYSSLVTAGQKAAEFVPVGFDDMYHFGTTEDGLGDDSTLRRICLTETRGTASAKCTRLLPAKIDFTNDNFYEVISR